MLSGPAGRSFYADTGLQAIPAEGCKVAESILEIGVYLAGPCPAPRAGPPGAYRTIRHLWLRNRAGTHFQRTGA